MENEQQQTVQELSFESEEARISALDALEEIPENIDRISEIQNAPLRPKDVASADEGGAADPGDSGAAAAQPSGDAQPTPPPTGSTPPAPADADEVFTIKRSELPQGVNGEKYSSVGQLLKAFKEKDELVGRQQTFIREKLSQPNDAAQQALARAQAAEEKAGRAEQELQSLRQKLPGTPPAPAPGAPQAGMQPGTQRAIAGNQQELADLQAELDALDKDEDQLSDEAMKRRNQVVRRIATVATEVRRLSDQKTRELDQAIASVRQEIGTLRNETSQVIKSTKQQREQEQHQAALESEFRTMDEFAKANPEFTLSKASRDVDSEYSGWASQVASVMYGRPPRGPKEMLAAVRQLQMQSPDLVSKCQMAGIPTAPSADVLAYLQICDLIDYQEGWRQDPVTGEMKRITRRGNDGSVEIDRFPAGTHGLQAAYTYRQAMDGTYAARMESARTESGRSALAAAQRRDRGAVEINEPEAQGRGMGAGSQPEKEEAFRQWNAIDETEAVIQARSGNTKALDEFNRLGAILGHPPVTV